MKAKILSTGLNLRSTPIIENNVITILKKSNELDILEPDSNGWTKIQWGIYSGYVSSKFIQVIPEVLPDVMTLALRALNVAIYQLGNAEIPHGSNWGKHVEKYLKSVGISVPSPWCMGFIYWCVNEASKEMNLPNPLKKTGGVMDQWNSSKHLRVTTPQKGDIFIMDFGGGKGHTGFVTSVVNDKINTVEGNSNDEGSREGYEVCRKPNGRKISSCKGFLRIG